MKKIVYIIIAVACVLLSACSGKGSASNPTGIELTVAQMQGDLPLDLGNGVILQSITYDNKARVLTFSYVSDERNVNVGAFVKAQSAQKRFLTTLLSSDDSAELVQMLVDAGSSIDYKYHGTLSGEDGTVHFSNDDLKDIAGSNDSTRDARGELTDLVAITRAQCPLEFDGPDMLLDSVVLTDDNINFYVSCNSERYDLRGNFDAFRSSLLDGARSEFEDDFGRMQGRLMKELN
ncbi:MAG: hypothetical protein K2M55_04645, partial [Muribaculaceae bacterium]|nr:hypothetical protein [Muribaculaceae bacterium]